MLYFNTNVGATLIPIIVPSAKGNGLAEGARSSPDFTWCPAASFSV